MKKSDLRHLLAFLPEDDANALRPEMLTSAIVCVTAGVVRLFVSNELDDEMLLIEAGPGQLIPSMAVKIGGPTKLRFEFSPSSKVRILPHAKLSMLLGTRPNLSHQLFLDFTAPIEHLTNVHFIRSVPEPARIPHLLSKYDFMPFLHHNGIVSLPPYRVLSLALDMSFSAIKGSLEELERQKIIRLTDDLRFGEPRINVDIIDMPALDELIERNANCPLRILIAGDDLPKAIDDALTSMMRCSISRFYDPVDLKRHLVHAAPRYSLLLFGGFMHSTPAWKVPLCLIQSGHQSMRKMMSHSVFVTPEKYHESIARLTGFCHTITPSDEAVDRVVFQSLLRISGKFIPFIEPKPANNIVFLPQKRNV